MFGSVDRTSVSAMGKQKKNGGAAAGKPKPTTSSPAGAGAGSTKRGAAESFVGKKDRQKLDKQNAKQLKKPKGTPQSNPFAALGDASESEDDDDEEREGESDTGMVGSVGPQLPAEQPDEEEDDDDGDDADGEDDAEEEEEEQRAAPVKGSKHDIWARVRAHKEQGVGGFHATSHRINGDPDDAVAMIQAASFGGGAPMSAAQRKKTLKAAKKKARKAGKRQLEDAEQPAASRQKIGYDGGRNAGWSGQVSDAFFGGRFDDALALLEHGRAQKQVPKLGALQRWVAGLGDGATTQPGSLKLFDALLRVADGLGVALKTPSAAGTTTFLLRKDGGGYGIKMTPEAVVTSVKGVSEAAGVTTGCRIVNIDGQVVRRKEEVLACVKRSPPNVPLEITVIQPKSAAAAAAPPVEGTGVLRTLPEWAPTPLHFAEEDASESVVSVEKVLASVHNPTAETAVYADVQPAAEFNANLRVLSHEKGADRTPPNLHDLDIYYPTPSAFPFAPTQPGTKRHDVPFVPGAFVVSDVLTPKECRMIMGMAEAAGFVPDQPANTGRKLAAATEAGLGDRAANFTLFADDTLLLPLYERVRALLPAEIGGGKLAGLNARWRFYRYLPGAVYRPHIDGAWPASGLKKKAAGVVDPVEPAVACKDSEGDDVEYVYDASGDRRSRLTFLLYLNEDFGGGCTTFFNADPETVGVVEARGVAPRCGSVLCFPHGEGAGSRVHEGSAVAKGAKYIVRTDVLYTLPPVDAASGRRQKQNASQKTKPAAGPDKKWLEVSMAGISNQDPMRART